MDDFSDAEGPLSCGYCGCYLGILAELLNSTKLNEHKCLSYFENATIDNGKVFGTNNESMYDTATTEFAGCSTSSAGHTEEPKPIKNTSLTDLSNKSPTEMKENIWTNEITKLLITTYKENMVKFESPLYNKKQVWELISEKLKKKNILKSGDKCNEKWRNLKKTYEKVLKDKNTTGNAPVYWKFFDAMHEIYFKDPHFNPIFTMSTTGLCKKRTCSTSSEDQTNETMDENNETQMLHTSVNKRPDPAKYKKPRYTERELDDRRQQRHEEKLKLKKEMFEWFKQNFKKD